MSPKNNAERDPSTAAGRSEEKGQRRGDFSPQVDRSIAKERDLLSRILEGLPGIFYLCNKEGRFLKWNRRFEEVSGYSSEQMSSARPMDFFDQQEKPGVESEIRKVFESGYAEIEANLLTRSGRLIPYHFNGTLIDIDGEPCLMGMGLDITARTRAEAERDASEQRMRLAMAAARMGVWETDIEKGTQSWDDEYWRLFGCPEPRPATTEEFFRLVHPDDHESLHEAFARSLEENCDYEAEYRIIWPDGQVRWHSVLGHPIFDYSGKPSRMLGVGYDVTERKRAEEALRSSEEQLRQSQKMEAFGQLAAGVAHDFNNLLTVISGYGELLLMKLPEDDPNRNAVESIVDAGARAAALTRQLLAFTRMTVLDARVVDLNAVVEDMEKMLPRLIGDNIVLKTALAGDLHLVNVDPSRIGQVLLNLVINARDAMPRGGTLTIETRNAFLDGRSSAISPRVQPGSYVQLAVSDTGVGIAPGDLGRIFEPFFTTKSAGKGTGLGLAVVHGIVKQSGGAIEVKSEPGLSTSFKVYLPTAGVHRAPQGVHADAASLDGKETILLVEDEDAVRGFAVAALTKHGYTVLEAADGAAAIDIAASQRKAIDLLLTDVVMPGLDGGHLAERLMELFPQLKVLFVSGYTDDETIRREILHKHAAFLQKPYSPIDLVAKVREVLGGAGDESP